tara:strand:+ start:33 stop:215 length:183 start_codon:yes stop_codon:yes gene_type:complete
MAGNKKPQTQVSQKVMITMSNEQYKAYKAEADQEMRSVGNLIQYKLLQLNSNLETTTDNN